MTKQDRSEVFASVFLVLGSGVGASFLFMLMALLFAPLVQAQMPLTSEDAALDREREHAGTLHVRTISGRIIRHVPKLDTQVSMKISALFARVKVTQRFRNPSPEWVEAVYAFPLPDQAAVDHLRMRIGERLIEGEIKPRAQARKIYQQAREQGQRASLLEQQRPNLFTSSVANIPPGGELSVEIDYQQPVQFRDDTFSLRFPLAMTPRYVPGEPIVERTTAFSAHGWAAPTHQVPDAPQITPLIVDPAESAEQSYPLSLEIDLNAGVPLASVVSPSHTLNIREISQQRRHLMLANDTQVANRDFVLRWQVAAAATPQAGLFHETHAGKHYQLLMLVPPKASQVAAQTLPARELVLVIDTSGSMHGESIEQARTALQMAVDALRPIDRFNIIQFNSQTHRLFAQPVPANRQNRQRAQAYIAQLQADGGTNMLPAMTAALQQPRADAALRQVVFLTDGAIANERELFALIHQELGASRLFPVGIGAAPNSYFMDRAASFGRGTFTFIGDLSEVASKMRGLLNRLRQPVLTDIHLDWQGAKGVELAPEQVADLYAGEPLMISLQADKPADSVLISGRLGEREWRHQVSLQGGAQAPGTRVIWARRMIADAMAERSMSGDSETLRQRIVQLAMTHHLVSKFTSLVAVEQQPVRPQDEPLHSKPLPQHLPKGWGQGDLLAQRLAMMPSTATPAPLAFLLGLLTWLVAGFVWWSRRGLSV